VDGAALGNKGALGNVVPRPTREYDDLEIAGRRSERAGRPGRPSSPNIPPETGGTTLTIARACLPRSAPLAAARAERAAVNAASTPSGKATRAPSRAATASTSATFDCLTRSSASVQSFAAWLTIPRAVSASFESCCRRFRNPETTSMPSFLRSAASVSRAASPSASRHAAARSDASRRRFCVLRSYAGVQLLRFRALDIQSSEVCHTGRREVRHYLLTPAIF
jgi:hypothetical protein